MKSIIVVPVPYPSHGGGQLSPEAATANVVILIIVIVVFVLAFLSMGPWMDGDLDGTLAYDYQREPTSDHYTGWRRKVYLWGFKRAYKKKALNEERNKQRHIKW